MHKLKLVAARPIRVGNAEIPANAPVAELVTSHKGITPAQLGALLRDGDLLVDSPSPVDASDVADDSERDD